MKNIQFTIITICLNSEKTIERTIKSVLSQSNSNYEYIIIDGKSTDGTMDIINSYEAFFGNKLRVISEPDEGLYDAMNKGVKLATGNYVSFLNSDDYYVSDTIEKLTYYKNCMSERKILSGNVIFQYQNGKSQLLKASQKRYNKKIRHYQNGLRFPATFFPKNVFYKYGLFDNNIKIAADLDFIVRLNKFKYPICFIDEDLAFMLDEGISNSKNGLMELYRNHINIVKKNTKSKFLITFYKTYFYLKYLLLKRYFHFLTYFYRVLKF